MPAIPLPPPRLRHAVEVDLPAIMALERGPDFERFVGRSDLAEHRALFASDNHVYLVGEGEGGALDAFAILRDLADPHAGAYLKRVAVARPGEGRGTAFLAAVIDWLFSTTAAHRFALDCFSDNLRARRAYEKLGFTADGILREAYRLPDGTRKDLTLMALLRREWKWRGGR